MKLGCKHNATYELGIPPQLERTLTRKMLISEVPVIKTTGENTERREKPQEVSIRRQEVGDRNLRNRRMPRRSVEVNSPHSKLGASPRWFHEENKSSRTGRIATIHTVGRVCLEQ